MSGQPLHRRLEALFWDRSRSWRRPLRRLRQAASLAAHRIRRLTGLSDADRVVSRPAEQTRAEPTPLVAVAGSTNCDPATIGRFLSRQTESSVTRDPGRTTPFLLMAEIGGIEDLPATHMESMVMAAVAEDLDQVISGWSGPAECRFGPTGLVHRRHGSAAANHLLLRRPAAERQQSIPVIGRAVSHICSASDLTGSEAINLGGTRAGPHVLRGDRRPGAVIPHPVHSIFDALAGLPAEAGPRTALFLLPYLAVGGAERLLYDLLWGVAKHHRSIVVTFEPHLASLGQTLDVARDLTPHVYSLGDWLPRETHLGALRHLIRRWSVECLVSWNGTVAFYDHAAELKAEFPRLRILNQLYNHQGAWIRRTTPTLLEAVDLHVAVNGRIAGALEHEWAVPSDRITTIHHAVDVPELPPPPEVERRRRARCRALGIPPETVVVGTFARMHPHKRPMDVIRLARRMADRNVHFLMVGGGPLDAAVNRELARHPHHNLTRLGLRHDTDKLMDAVDICLLPSQYEGLPVFLLEGMARQVPAVATAVGDVPMLLERGGGIVSGRPGDLAALESAIETLIDDHRRAAEGDKARIRIEQRFGLDRYVREYEAAIFPSHPPQGALTRSSHRVSIADVER